MMKFAARVQIILIIGLLLGGTSQAEILTLKGRSAIELTVGLWGGGAAENTINDGRVTTEAGTNGFTGGLGYAYWLREHLALTITGSLLSARATTTVNYSTLPWTGPMTLVTSSAVSENASAVIPLLIGVRYYVPTPEPDENIRPFLSFAIGSYFGFEASNTAFSQQARTESALGIRLGLGIDFFTSEHIKLGVNGGYHLMTNFNSEVGGRRNYNTGEFAFGIGYIF